MSTQCKKHFPQWKFFSGLAIRISLHNINKFPKLTRQLQNALRLSRNLKISRLSRRTVRCRLYTREDRRENAPTLIVNRWIILENFLLWCIGHFFNFTISLHNLNNGMLNWNDTSMFVRLGDESMEIISRSSARLSTDSALSRELIKFVWYGPYILWVDDVIS